MQKDLERLVQKIKRFPTGPGCYLFKSATGHVLYIGKAKNLKNRVLSYFRSGQKSLKTEYLVNHVKDVDFLLVENEAQAYVVENNLIKKHTPKYNIRLKDDKTYPYVEINKTEPFPRLAYTRRPGRGKGKVLFGPFAVGSNLSQVIKTLTKSFGLRDCSLREFNLRKEPCLLYQLEQCLGPCVDLVSEEKYDERLSMAVDIFKGKGAKGIEFLEQKMFQASENEEFEKAAIYRDELSVISEFLQYTSTRTKQGDHQFADLDVIAFYEGEWEVDLCLLLIRDGLHLGQKHFYFAKNNLESNTEELVVQFLLQYYSKGGELPPKKIAIELENELKNHLNDALAILLKKGPQVSDKKGSLDSFLELAHQNAVESQRVRLENQKSETIALNKLAELTGLNQIPRVIECIDVAIWQGKSPTASQVVFHDGRPDKQAYRYYHLQERAEGNNDFAMIAEMLERRLKKPPYPDLFIIDGGKGQLGVVQKVLKQNNFEIPCVAIAKAKTRNGTEERLFIPNRKNPYLLKQCRALLNLVVHMRDEAHRFSRKLHHKKEKERVFESWLDEIKGIGEKTKQKIQQKMTEKSLTKARLAEMTLAELTAHLEVAPARGKLIYDHLRVS